MIPDGDAQPGLQVQIDEPRLQVKQVNCHEMDSARALGWRLLFPSFFPWFSLVFLGFP